MPEEKNYIIDKLDAIEDRLEEILKIGEQTTKYKIETNDKQEYYQAFHGSDFCFACHDLDQDLRNKIKYGAEQENLDIDTLQYCRNKLRECLDNNGVDLEHVS
jgi:hypothetical protein